MGTTELRQRGSNRLNDRQMRFVLEYLINFNGKESAIAAGYPARTASIRACKLLKNKKVAAMVGKLRRETAEKLELSREEVLWQLYCMGTRSGVDFVDKKGILILNHRVVDGEVIGKTIHDLPERAKQAVDGIEQKVTRYYEDDVEVEEVETKLKLASKLKAIDLMMKHKGMFAPIQVGGEVKLQFDWDKFLEGPNGNVVDVEVIEDQKFLEKE